MPQAGKHFGESAIFVWKGVLTNSLGANLIPCSGAVTKTAKRKGGIALHETTRRLHLLPEQKMESAVLGGEARSRVMGHDPLIFSKLVSKHAGLGAGDGKDQKELSPCEITERALDLLRPWLQGHLRQVCKLSQCPPGRLQ